MEGTTRTDRGSQDQSLGELSKHERHLWREYQGFIQMSQDAERATERAKSNWYRAAKKLQLRRSRREESQSKDQGTAGKGPEG